MIDCSIQIFVISLILGFGWPAHHVTYRGWATQAIIKDQVEQQAFGTINESVLKQIKQIIANRLSTYKQSELHLPQAFSLEAKYNIERNGSLSGITISKSSGFKIIDQDALQILWNISESHVFAFLMSLSPNTVRFDITKASVRLVISGFSISQTEARSQAEMLNQFLKAMSQSKIDRGFTQILSTVLARSEDKRVDIEMSVSRARAGELMQVWLGDKLR